MDNHSEDVIMQEAEREFISLTTDQVKFVSELDGDTRRRELARYELERRNLGHNDGVCASGACTAYRTDETLEPCFCSCHLAQEPVKALVTCPQCEGVPDMCNGYCEGAGVVTATHAEEWQRQNDETPTQHQMRNIGNGSEPNAPLRYAVRVTQPQYLDAAHLYVDATSEENARALVVSLLIDGTTITSIELL